MGLLITSPSRARQAGLTAPCEAYATPIKMRYAALKNREQEYDTPHPHAREGARLTPGYPRNLQPAVVGCVARWCSSKLRCGETRLWRGGIGSMPIPWVMRPCIVSFEQKIGSCLSWVTCQKTDLASQGQWQALGHVQFKSSVGIDVVVNQGRECLPVALRHPAKCRNQILARRHTQQKDPILWGLGSVNRVLGLFPK